MQLKGRIELIKDAQQVTSTFTKRELVLTTDENTDYPQSVLVEFTQDKTSLLDQYNVGDVVTVDINIRGRKWTAPDGVDKYFNTIQAWKIFQAETSHEGEVVESQSADSKDWIEDDSDDLPF